MPVVRLADYLRPLTTDPLAHTAYGHLGGFDLADFLAQWAVLHAQALAELGGARIYPSAVVHPTALLGSDVHLSANVTIAAINMCTDMRRPDREVLMRHPDGLYRCRTAQFGALIGNNVQSGNHISIGPGVALGEGCRIDSGVTLAARTVPAHHTLSAPHHRTPHPPTTPPPHQPAPLSRHSPVGLRNLARRLRNGIGLFRGRGGRSRPGRCPSGRPRRRPERNR